MIVYNHYVYNNLAQTNINKVNSISTTSTYCLSLVGIHTPTVYVCSDLAHGKPKTIHVSTYSFFPCRMSYLCVSIMTLNKQQTRAPNVKTMQNMSVCRVLKDVSHRRKDLINKHWSYRIPVS